MQTPGDSCGYRYQRFGRHELRDASGFAPDTTLPRVPLTTTDGRSLHVDDLLKSGPLVVIAASITCPMAEAANVPLQREYARAGDDVQFLTLYTREAHPGERYPQPSTLEEKIAHARAFGERHRVPWTVVVDDLDGTLHRALDPKPNAVYFINTRGDVVYRVLWAGDVRGLRKGLDRLRRPGPVEGASSTARVMPMMRALGVLDAVLALAGPSAQRDFRRAAPVGYAAGWLMSRAFPKRVTPSNR